MDNPSATLPAAFFQGKPLEEGSRCEIEIVNAEGGNVEVRYVPHGTESSAEEVGDRTHADFNGMVDKQAQAGY